MVNRRRFLGAASLGLAGVWVGPGSARGQGVEESARKALKPAPPSPPKADERVDRNLAAVRDRHKLPGIIGAVVKGESLAAIGAVGVRKLGSDDPIRATDRVHLGSDTKAITATLLGMLVDQKALTWSSTVGDVFPKLAKNVHPDFRGVTLWQLLTHRSGLPANGPWWTLKGRTTTEKRRDLLVRMMKNAPESKPGTAFLYSNVGYAIAGLMAEQVTSKPWEDLFRERIFAPLGMATAGFGPPGTPGQLDEPWGHDGKGRPSQFDNAPALGPAGTVHASVPDWAKFVSLHLLGDRGKARLLTPETFRFLHTPPGGQNYAGGWGVVDQTAAGGKALAHSGSNTTWYCTAWLAPARGFGVLVATNQGGDAAEKACQEAVQGLIRSAPAVLKG